MVHGRRPLVEAGVGHVSNRFMILMLLTLTGCSSQQTITSNAGSWNVSYTPSTTKEIPLNELFEIRSEITGTGMVKSLRVDAAMPAHGHGMMTDTITKLQDDGSYLTTGMLLHMPGNWEIYFDIDNGETIERAQDSIILAP